jgi:hypothetical protein
MIDFWAVGFEVAEKMGLIPQLREVLRLASRRRPVTDWLMRRFVNDRYTLPGYGGGGPDGGPM